MIALPPLVDGAVNVTDAWALPAVAVPMVGAPGTDGRTVNEKTGLCAEVPFSS